MVNKEIKRTFGFRKHKAYGLCAATLGAIAVLSMTSDVQAQEVDPNISTEITNNPATNLEGAQPSETVEHIEASKNPSSSNGELNIEIDNSKVEEAAKEAAKEGVVITEETKDLGVALDNEDLAKKQAELKKDQEKQIAELKKKEKDQKEAQDAYKREKERIEFENARRAEENEAITNSNNNKTQAYETEKARIEAENARIRQENEQANSSNSTNTSNYEAEKERIKNHNAQVDIENAAITERNNKKTRDYEAEKARVEAHNANINSSNANISAENERKQKEYEAKLADYNKDLEKYNRKLNEITELVNQNNNNPDFVTEETESNTWTNLSPKELNGITVTSKGDVTSKESLTDGSFSILVKGEHIQKNQVIEHIFWEESVTPVGDSVIPGNKINELAGTNAYDIEGQPYSIKSGTSFIIKNAVKTADNVKRDLEVTLTKVKTTDYGDDWLVFWNQNGSINYYNGHNNGVDQIGSGVSVTYKIAGDDSTKYLWANVSLDIDLGQILNLGPNAIIVGVGGGLTQEGNRNASSNEELGSTYGKNNSQLNALNGIESLPDGAVAWVAYGNSFTKTLTNSPGGNSNGVADGDFGLKLDIQVPEEPGLPPIKPKLDQDPGQPLLTPEKPNLEPLKEKLPEPTPPTNIPVKPELENPTPPVLDPLKPMLDLPEKPSDLTAIKYDYILKAKVENIKAVTNEDGVNVNDTLVPKASDVRWVLNNETLKAGRDYTTSYVMVDPLPVGFIVDEVATSANSPAYIVSYDKSKHVITFTATESTLKSFNDDINTIFAVPIATIAGRVINDGATYTNAFETIIGTLERIDENGSDNPKPGTKTGTYKVKSNIVSVFTPGSEKPREPRPRDPKDPNPPVPENPTPNDNLIKPVKDNKDETGTISINGKAVVAESDNYYTLLWDLDQYKDMKSTKESIQKGFYYIDDYPEEALLLKESEIKILDKSGKEVKGITVSHYDSVANAPDSVKEMLKIADITKLKGAFQLFSVDNPQSFFDNYVVKGNSLTIVTPMTIKKELAKTGGEYKNNAFQVDFGNGYYSNETINVVPIPKPEKHDLNKDGVNIDGKTVLAGSTHYYTLDWDFSEFKNSYASSELIAKGFYFIDDFPEEAVDINTNDVKVTLNGTTLDGISINVYNSLSEAPEDLKLFLKENNIEITGTFQAFKANDSQDFFNKYVKTGSKLTIIDPMTVKEEFHNKQIQYTNKAYQINFGQGFNTTPRINQTPPPNNTVKENKNLADININGKPYLAGEVNKYVLTWDLNPYNGLVASSEDIAKGFYIIDDYPEEAVTINNKEVKVYANGKLINDVLVNSYNSLTEVPKELQDLISKNKLEIKGAIQVISAKNPKEFYEKYVTKGINLKIETPMTVKMSMKDSNKEYKNKSIQLDFGQPHLSEIVKNNIPNIDPIKKGENTEGVNINGKPVNANSEIVYKLTWDLSPYKGIEVIDETIAKGFYFIDDYPEEAVNIVKVGLIDSNGKIVKGVSHNIYKSINDAPKELQEHLKSNNIKTNGSFHVFSADNPREFYEKYVQTGLDITINDHMIVKKEMQDSGKSFNNISYQIDFGQGYTTDKIVNHVPIVKPKKQDNNKDGIDINGLPVNPGSVNYYKLTWDLSEYKGIEEVKSQILKGFYYVDDFPEEAVVINSEAVVITDSKGNIVNGITVKQYSSLDETPKEFKEQAIKAGFKPKGAFQLFSADNPEEFYNKYVKTGLDLIILDPMVVKEEMKDSGNKYKNQTYQLEFGNGRFSNIVENYVPKVDPLKENLNKNGVNIDNKNVLPGSTNIYKLTWDLSPYKGIKEIDSNINKGFYYVDDFPEEAVVINKENITIKDSNGNKVEGISINQYNSIEEAPEAIKELFKNNKYVPKGAFQVFSADNAKEFYSKYVQTGLDIIIIDPMTVKEEMAVNGGEYINKVYQFDFGIMYEGESTINNVPKIDPKKDVTIEINGESVNDQIIELNQMFNYKLIGALLPNNRSEALFEYRFIDDYDQTHDKYDSKYKVFTSVDIKLLDGTVINKGTDITEFTSQEVNLEEGIVDIKLNQDFLEKVSNDSEFQAEVYLEMERIAYGDVENKYENYINGVKVISNTVITHTPPPTPENPPVPGKELPNTGEENNLNVLIGASILALSSGLMFTSKKKEEN